MYIFKNYLFLIIMKKHYDANLRNIDYSKTNEQYSSKINYGNNEHLSNINYGDSVNKESLLIKSSLSSNKKSEKEEILSKEITYGAFFGDKKGQNNQDVDNFLRNGESSRLSNNEYLIDRESSINDRSDFLNKNFQDPKNIVLPFPRGGEITRQQTQLVENNNQDSTNKVYKFKY